MLYFGIKLRRWKMLLYPLMFVVNPFFNWYYMVYGIFTAGQRTWGGPRADAAAADDHTTAREAIKQAELQGDDLNIIPETFKPAYEAQKARSQAVQSQIDGLVREKSQVRPPKAAEGKFSARRKTATGTYAHLDETDNSVGAMASSRDSLDRVVQIPSGDHLVHIPPDMEECMGEEDRRKYAIAQRAQQVRRYVGSELREPPRQG